MYNIVICDDDHNYVEYLEEIIKATSSQSQSFSVNKFYCGEDFLDAVDQRYDLVFLDMQMGKIDGITTALNYRKYDQDALLVFCTGIQEPKPEFFDVQPFRYLMKSYPESKMRTEIKIILSKMIENKKEIYFVAFCDGKMQKIPISDIMYISKLKRGCCIHVFSEKTKQSYKVNSNQKLEEVYQELKNESFEYAHNSYIVNFRAIVGDNNDVITLQDLTALNISRSKKEVFHSSLARYLGGKYKRDRKQWK